MGPITFNPAFVQSFNALRHLALEGQAKITGSATNSSLQASVQAETLEGERWRQGIARQKRNSGDALVAGLRRVEAMKKRQENGDLTRRSPWVPGEGLKKKGAPNKKRR